MRVQLCQTNPLYTERELKYQMIDSGAKAIITLDILFPRISKVVKETIGTCNYYGNKRLLAISKNLFIHLSRKKNMALL